MAAALAQPDVTLLLDMSGVIREATVSSRLSDESVDRWLGAPWVDTVADYVGDKVRRIVEDARDSGISAFRQVTQRFPSGREMPIEYTTVLLGGRAGLMAVGKSLVAVAELQSRFVAAQQAMERDYWKLREIETRYRLLFNHSTQPVLVVRADDLAIEEANPVATQVLGLGGSRGKNLLAVVAPAEQGPLRALLQRARDQGKPSAVRVQLRGEDQPWLVRASSIKGDPSPLLLVQMIPVVPSAALDGGDMLPSDETTLSELADPFVLVDGKGIVRRANQAFADLVDMPSPAAVTDESLDRWIGRPGADLPLLLSTLKTHQVTRLFPSGARSELDVETEVEISGTTVPQDGRTYHALVIRDVGRRLSRFRDPRQMETIIESVAEPVGRMPLKQLIRSTVDGVERHYIRAALDLVGGNRTAAAELLGLSRQSLYIKLGRYGLEEDVPEAQLADG